MKYLIILSVMGLWGCNSYNLNAHEVENLDLHKLVCKTVKNNYPRLIRYENKEVICYGHDHIRSGLSCKFKEKKY